LYILELFCKVGEAYTAEFVILHKNKIQLF
jgi:hypothetical protein